MKPNWPIKKLGEVAGIIVGKTPATIDYLNGGDYKVLKYRDISKNGISWNISDKGFVKQASLKGLKEVQIGDLLITSAGHSSEKIGEEAVVVEELPSQFKKVFFASELICYRASPKIILPDWLLLYILSEFGQNQLKKIIGDSVHLTKEKSQEIEIPVPGIEEQKRIVKKLEKILAKIEETKNFRTQSLAETNVLLRTALDNLFTAKENKKNKKLSEVVKRVGGGTPSRSKKEYFEGNIPWFTVTDLPENDGRLITVATPRQFITEDAIKYSATKLIPKGSVLLATRVGVGKVAIAGTDVTTNQDFSSFIPHNELNNRFLGYFLLSQKEYFDRQARGITIKGITTDVIDNSEMSLPNLKEQEKIVAYLDSLSEKVQKLQRLQQEQLEELKTLQQSVLHQAFQGELSG